MTNNKVRPKIYQIVATFDLESIPPGDPETEESWDFRIELLKECGAQGEYFPRVCRRETYNLLPTYPRLAGKSVLKKGYAHEIIVEDTSSSWDEIRGNSPDEVLNLVLNEINRIFSCKFEYNNA